MGFFRFIGMLQRGFTQYQRSKQQKQRAEQQSLRAERLALERERLELLKMQLRLQQEGRNRPGGRTSDRVGPGREVPALPRPADTDPDDQLARSSQGDSDNPAEVFYCGRCDRLRTWEALVEVRECVACGHHFDATDLGRSCPQCKDETRMLTNQGCPECLEHADS
jgi:Zn ribbon nucleic-acid-binding protein